MRKTTFTWIGALLCLYLSTTLHGQQLAAWALAANGQPTFLAAEVAATPLIRGNGISEFDYSGPLATSTAWHPLASPNTEDYIEIRLSPELGYRLQIDSLAFIGQRDAAGIRSLSVQYSTDGFASSQTLAQESLPGNTQAQQYELGSLSLSVCEGRELSIRWHGYEADLLSGQWGIGSIAVFGSAIAACSPPAGSVSNFAAAQFGSNWANISWQASGEHLLILARPLGALAAPPSCDGSLPLADSQLGQGDEVGTGQYAVYSGSDQDFTLSGLVAGEAYELDVYLCDPLNACCPTAPSASLIITLPCAGPSSTAEIAIHPADGMVYLSWALPPCFDALMLLGSTNTISASPSLTGDDDYLPDTVFGAASGTGDLPPGVFPLYFGQGDRAAITNLDNGQTYFFRLYARYNGTWAALGQAETVPKAGCQEMNGDFLYISELHYRNSGEPVDQGVELTGPAGLSLSNYTLVAYKADNLDTSVGDGGYFHIEGELADLSGGYGAVWVPMPGLFGTGMVGLYNKVSQQVVQLFSYRAPWPTAKGGIADGIAPMAYVAPAESTNQPLGLSMQRGGLNGCPDAMGWQGPFPSTPSVLNNDMQGGPLPISLLSFEARPVGHHVRLDWRTESEANNDYMAVERSADGRIYKELGRVAGAGNSQQLIHYQWVDEQPLPGLSYYRLRQVDYDGQQAYYGPVSVRLAKQGPTLAVYPTAAKSTLTVELDSDEPKAGEFRLFDTYGRLLRQLPHSGDKTSFLLYLDGLPSGTYYLQWNSRGQSILVQRFFKL